MFIKIKDIKESYPNLPIKGININDYNFLNVDVQGSDLNVILSFGELLNKIDFVYSEINTVEVWFLKRERFLRTRRKYAVRLIRTV